MGEISATEKLIIDKIDTLGNVVSTVALDVREIKTKQHEHEKVQLLMQEECIRRKREFEISTLNHCNDLEEVKKQLLPLFKVKSFLVVCGWIIGSITSVLVLAGLVGTVFGWMP